MRFNIRTSACLLAAVLALMATTGMSAKYPFCGNIAKLDFANMTLTVPGQGPVKLKNGKGEITGIVDGVQMGPRWFVELRDDIILKPAPDVTLRLIDLWTDHLDGAGSLGYALMYECKGGSLRRVFRTQGYVGGLTIKKVDDGTFTIRHAVYRRKDPECCPSMRATDTYVWFPKDHTFKRVKSVEAPLSHD